LRRPIVNASDVLDDVVTDTIPGINAEREIGARLHSAAPGERYGCVGGG